MVEDMDFEKHAVRMIYHSEDGVRTAWRPSPSGSSQVLEFRSPNSWKQKPGVWNGRVSLAGRIDWNHVLGLVTMVGVSVAGWAGVVFAFSRLLR